jgi:hypothetical protein
MNFKKLEQNVFSIFKKKNLIKKEKSKILDILERKRFKRDL